MQMYESQVELNANDGKVSCVLVMYGDCGGHILVMDVWLKPKNFWPTFMLATRMCNTSEVRTC